MEYSHFQFVLIIYCSPLIQKIFPTERREHSNCYSSSVILTKYKLFLVKTVVFTSKFWQKFKYNILTMLPNADISLVGSNWFSGFGFVFFYMQWIFFCFFQKRLAKFHAWITGLKISPMISQNWCSILPFFEISTITTLLLRYVMFCNTLKEPKHVLFFDCSDFRRKWKIYKLEVAFFFRPLLQNSGLSGYRSLNLQMASRVCTPLK